MITRDDMVTYMRELLYCEEDTIAAIRQADLADEDRLYLERNMLRKEELIKKILALYTAR